MTYSVKEIFYTLQGEGGQAGTPAVFCRFAGCNLWTGREQDRAQAVCQFCDTDFVGTDGTLGGKFETATALAERIAAQWPAGAGHRLVVLTGGEPLLQVDRGTSVTVHFVNQLDQPSSVHWHGLRQDWRMDGAPPLSGHHRGRPPPAPHARARIEPAAC